MGEIERNRALYETRLIVEKPYARSSRNCEDGMSDELAVEPVVALQNENRFKEHRHRDHRFDLANPNSNQKFCSGRGLNRFVVCYGPDQDVRVNEARAIHYWLTRLGSP